MILSQEYKIPCVIGTKIATDLIKDGQYIRLDANNGIVELKPANESLEDAYITYRRRLKYFPIFFGEVYTGTELRNIIDDNLKYFAFA